MSWEHRDISNASIKTSKGAAELEPLGMNAGLLNPYSTPHQQKSLTQLRTYPGFTEEGSTQCMLNGIETPCSLISSENSAQCPNNDCGPRGVMYEGKETLALFEAHADGYQGFVPVTARYIGNGGILPISRLHPRLIEPGSRPDTRGDTNLGDLNGATDPEGVLGLSPDAFFSHPQNLRKLDPLNPPDIVNGIFRKVQERNKATERNRKAWWDYQRCVLASPESIEYEQAFRAANLRASIPLPGASGAGRVTMRTIDRVRRGQGIVESLLTRANVLTFVFGGLLSVLVANPFTETQSLRDKLKPVRAGCMNQVKERYGFRPVDPFYYGNPNFHR
jgi:hypothetical protein